MFEGWIVKTCNPECMHWIIKGYRHPDDAYIAMAYRIGRRRLSLEESRFILNTNLRYVKCIGRYAHVVSREYIIYSINPHEVFRLRKKDLPKSIIELINNIRAEWIGISGSWAVFEESLRSDVDILVYDRDPKGVYKRLVEYAREGLIHQCHPTRHYRPLPRLYGFQVLNACYKGYKYTIRLLRRIGREACNDELVPLGYYRGPIKILDSSESFLVPAIYSVYIEGFGNALLETWHTRYQEIKPGRYNANLLLRESVNEGALIASPDIDGYIEVGSI